MVSTHNLSLELLVLVEGLLAPRSTRPQAPLGPVNVITKCFSAMDAFAAGPLFLSGFRNIPRLVRVQEWASICQMDRFEVVRL
ncbi:hypothetical protein C8R48DRAFT_728207, partial [Suillus tomentosus]